MSFKVALLGAGRIGRIHAANIAGHPGLELSFVCDPIREAAEDLAGRFGARVGDLDTTIVDPDVQGVVIATSTNTHLDLTLRANAAAKAVFCEKPVDLDLARARRAQRSLRAAPVLIGFNRRFDPSFSSLKAKLANGEIGNVETLQITSNDPSPPSVSYVQTSGGLFNDMSIHDLDMVRFLLEEEPSEVFAWGSCLVDPAIGKAGDIDTARIMLRTSSGKLAVIANSRRSGYGYDQRIEAFCSNGLASAANVMESTVHVWREGGVTSAPLQNFFLERYASAFRAEIDHFAAVIGGKKPQVTFEDGVAALALADAASQSLRTGQPVMLG